jgi:hypothetical protein
MLLFVAPALKPMGFHNNSISACLQICAATLGLFIKDFEIFGKNFLLNLASAILSPKILIILLN